MFCGQKSYDISISLCCQKQFRNAAPTKEFCILSATGTAREMADKSSTIRRHSISGIGNLGIGNLGRLVSGRLPA